MLFVIKTLSSKPKMLKYWHIINISMSNDCIFCKIAKGEAPAHILKENEQFMAFLDLFPGNKAQTVVISKVHLAPKFSEVDRDVMANAMNFAQEVAKLIEENLEDVNRVIIVVEGFDVQHFHIKLYPTYDPNPTKDAVGRGGDMANEGELKDLAEKIKGK